jgi:hypothetical protein
MCICRHGQDRHYLDYAGVGVCGGISGKCLEDGCKCTAFTLQTVTYFSNTIYHPTYWTTLY